MRSRGTLARWSAVSVVLCATIALGLSMYTLADPMRKGAREVGDCCTRPAEDNCSSCKGVWLCAEPGQPKSCSCVCSPIADDYGCPWTDRYCW
jgi:hypothetical protein